MTNTLYCVECRGPEGHSGRFEDQERLGETVIQVWESMAQKKIV